jgi:subtilase family serine protease
MMLRSELRVTSRLRLLQSITIAGEHIMNPSSLSKARFTRAAACAALFCLFGSSQLPAETHSRVVGMVSASEGRAPTDKFCRKNFGVPCYSPQEIRTAYGLNGLIDAGMVGDGQTIVLIDSYGSPTIAEDLRRFDAGFGLPDPPSFKVLAPLGTVPWDPATYPDQPGWAAETTLDVEWAHAMAPGASIVLLTSPVDETEGVQGLPEFLALETYALDHHLGKIISGSWGATENTLFIGAAGIQGPELVARYLAFHTRALLEQVTLLASAGDDGTSNLESDSTTFYAFPTVNFPASSPLVTAVGGTILTTDTSGNYQSETVWNDPGCCAGGGGISQLFHAPLYQELALPKSVQAQLRGMRGIPDISYNADCNNAILIYLSYFGPSEAGWYSICGTSEGSPQWAGIVADLNQYAGRPLGFLNPALYALGGFGAFDHFGRDITVGNNALVGVTGATAPGYSATPGWDLASGWGSPNLAELPGHAFELLEHY